MSYDAYFETGISYDGTRYVARYDGDFVGVYDTQVQAKRALALYRRKQA